MTNEDYRPGLDGFVADLNGVWRAAGSPPYAALESISRRVLRQHPAEGVRHMVLAPSTTSEILNGRRKQAPKWIWVLAFLVVLQAAAQQRGIDPAAVGTVEEWRRKHEAAVAAPESPLRRPRSDGQWQPKAQERGGVADSAPALGTAAARAADGEPDTLFRAFLAVIRQASVPQGRHGCRDIVPQWLEFYLTLESAAEIIRSYEPQFVPGLLQTEAYARAVIAQQVADATADEVTRLAGLYMRRQSQPRQQRPRHLWAVVEEAAFRSRRIDPRVMRDQVEHLIDVADDPHIALQIVRTGTAGNLALSEPMTIFRFPEPFLGDVVCLEQPGNPIFLHERENTDHYQQLFDNITLKAAPRDSTRRQLRKIRAEI